jgi:hypothetical protein
MVRDEVRKLQSLAKEIYLNYDDEKYHTRSDWYDLVVEAGLGIDQRTADSYYRLARIRGLIIERSKWFWFVGENLSQYRPKSELPDKNPHAGRREDAEPQ